MATRVRALESFLELPASKHPRLCAAHSRVSMAAVVSTILARRCAFARATLRVSYARQWLWPRVRRFPVPTVGHASKAQMAICARARRGSLACTARTPLSLAATLVPALMVPPAPTLCATVTLATLVSPANHFFYCVTRVHVTTEARVPREFLDLSVFAPPRLRGRRVPPLLL